MSARHLWEEDWSYAEGGGLGPIVVREGGEIVHVALSPAHARLIAAAPDLVRELLEIEWEGDGEFRGYRYCPSCAAAVARYPPMRPAEHLPYCTLLAALRKAGVRP